jgi:hypothetical protein
LPTAVNIDAIPILRYLLIPYSPSRFQELVFSRTAYRILVGVGLEIAIPV